MILAKAMINISAVPVIPLNSFFINLSYIGKMSFVFKVEPSLLLLTDVTQNHVGTPYPCKISGWEQKPSLQISQL